MAGPQGGALLEGVVAGWGAHALQGCRQPLGGRGVLPEDPIAYQQRLWLCRARRIDGRPVVALMQALRIVICTIT